MYQSCLRTICMTGVYTSFVLRSRRWSRISEDTQRHAALLLQKGYRWDPEPFRLHSRCFLHGPAGEVKTVMVCSLTRDYDWTSIQISDAVHRFDSSTLAHWLWAKASHEEIVTMRMELWSLKINKADTVLMRSEGEQAARESAAMKES